MFVARDHQLEIDQPITAWMGHDRPFDFALDYTPAKGISRLLSGTPSIISLAAMEASLDIWSQVDLPMVWAKSAAMSELFIRIVERRLSNSLVRLASPRDATRRGSHLGFHHPQGYAVIQAMIDRGVIGDFREPDLMRFGFAPLYTSFADVRRAATTLAEVVETRAWDQSRYRCRAAVT
jgi:kynureninase